MNKQAVMALAMALTFGGCPRGDATRITRIRVIGEVPEPLELRGQASIVAARDSSLCGKSSPLSAHFGVAKEQRFDAQFRRLDSRRYELVFDLQNAAHGGFCQWGLSEFSVLAKLSKSAQHESTVLVLRPVNVAAKARRGLASQAARAARPDVVHHAICSHRDQLLQCTDTGSVFQVFAGEGTFQLNVSWAEDSAHE